MLTNLNTRGIIYHSIKDRKLRLHWENYSFKSFVNLPNSATCNYSNESTNNENNRLETDNKHIIVWYNIMILVHLGSNTHIITISDVGVNLRKFWAMCFQLISYWPGECDLGWLVVLMVNSNFNELMKASFTC